MVSQDGPQRSTLRLVSALLNMKLIYDNDFKLILDLEQF